MALDESTNFALQNLGSLNKNFEDALSPLNNFAARNVQLAVAKQQIQQDQANKIAILQQQEDAENQRQARALTSQFQIAKLQEDSAMNHSLAIAKFQAGHEDAVRLKQQADAIRANPQARRVPGLKIASFSDTPEGNQGLISAFTQATSDPKVLQALDVEEAKGVNTQLSANISKLNATVPGSAQSRQAISAFLASPGNTDLLVKKGHLSSTDLQSMVNSGDPTKVTDAINQVANSAWFDRGAREYTSQLMSSWLQAQSSAGATPSAQQSLALMQMSGLQKHMETIVDRGNLFDPDAIAQVYGNTPPPATKLPPPPATTGIHTPASGAQTASYSQNPFGTPQPPVDPNSKVWPASLFSSQTPEGNAKDAVAQLGYLGAAFAPQKLASDPATEFAIRKSLLDSKKNSQLAVSAATSMIPFINNYQPSYDDSSENQDVAKLQTLVQGLYSPTAKP